MKSGETHFLFFCYYIGVRKLEGEIPVKHC